MAHARPAKRRRLSSSKESEQASGTIAPADLFSHAAEWSLEQTYERQPRSRKSKESTKLPIKTAEGRIELRHDEFQADEESDSFLGTGSESEADGADTPPTEEVDEQPQVPLKQQILAAQEELARIAEMMNEDPQAHIGSFKKLASIANPEAAPAIKKLALATQLAVYKDAIPGYRIRTYSAEDMGTKASKDVRQTRQYEHALVTGYQHYITELASFARLDGRSEGSDGLKQMAINCACTLLLAVPHFNLRTELLKILVNQLSNRHPSPYFDKCVTTLEYLFAADKDGAHSLEAVSLLTKMMKAKDYCVQEDVLNTFLHLRLLSEMSAKSSTSKTDKAEEPVSYGGKRLKSKWEPRSKKERKLTRERKAVEKDMKEADAVVSVEDRDRRQSQTLQMVFATYFRILKLGVSHLTGAVLEGLAKFAHLINQDFFGDLLEALKELVQTACTSESTSSENEATERPAGSSLGATRKMVRDTLLATQTAFTLLSGQDARKSASALHLDLTFFTCHLYKMLYELSLDPSIELGSKSPHPADPHAGQKADVDGSISHTVNVNVSTPMLLLTRILTSMLLTPSAPPPTITAVAFYKRLLTTTLQLPEKSTLVLVSLMSKVVQKHGRKIEALWYSDERKGDGNFQGGSDSMEGSNVLAPGSGVWEVELLRRHFSPQVRREAVASENQIQVLHR